MWNSTAMVAAIATLQLSLQSRGTTRCMGCNTYKRNDKRWRVAGYVPANPTHPPVAYALCGDCLKSKSKITKAERGIETMSRDMAERRATA